MNQNTKQLEALLLVAGEAVSKKELAGLLTVSIEDLTGLVSELQGELRHHGMALVVSGTHVQLTTSPSVADFLRQFEQEESQHLSKAAMETLTIIAYRGPVSRYDVDIIRGVDSRAMIRQLIKRGLLSRVSLAGQAPMYDVGEEFLRNVGIIRREELPQFTELSNDERLQKLLDSN